MQIFKTTTTINHFDIPANSLISIEANQSWLDGEAPDRYAGSMNVWNPDTLSFDYYGFVHEDTMATIGFHDDNSWPVKEGYCSLGDITYHGSVTDVPLSELPKELFTYYFQQETARLESYINDCLKNKSHYINLARFTSDTAHFTKQFNRIGIPTTTVIAKAVSSHNNTISKIKANKAAYKASIANSIGNHFPELAKLTA